LLEKNKDAGSKIFEDIDKVQNKKMQENLRRWV
jgi:hypothetical protein